MAPYVPVAGQSIPRFDLYAALGVDPSADDAAIEAAYWDLFGAYGGDAEASDDRRIVRARLAREWLTDPDRRSRYDASRARAAARSAAKAAAAAAAEAGTPEPRGTDAADELDDQEIAEDTIPWPAADLARQAAMERRAAELVQSESSIEWSATPAVPVEQTLRGRSARRPRRSRLRFVGWAALIVAGVAAVYLVLTALGSGGVAVRETPTPPPATPGATPTLAIPTTGPTVAPPTPAAPSPTAPGIDTAALQQSSWETLQTLIAAADEGDVKTAQSYLGDSAPGLRASGLRRAVFPDVTALQMTITQDGTGYVAVADATTRLTSPDGTSWTLDYGSRPLAAYRPPGDNFRDLWWTEGKVKHHIYLRISLATVSKLGVTATARWTFDPSLPDDATYFARSTLQITGLTLDDVAMAVTSTPVPMTGVTSLTTTADFTGAGSVPDVLGVVVEVTNPRPDGTNDRAVETTFLLQVR